jgi:hypothetical protein
MMKSVLTAVFFVVLFALGADAQMIGGMSGVGGGVDAGGAGGGGGGGGVNCLLIDGTTTDCLLISGTTTNVVLVGGTTACIPDGGTDWSKACDLPLLAAIGF